MGIGVVGRRPTGPRGRKKARAAIPLLIPTGSRTVTWPPGRITRTGHAGSSTGDHTTHGYQAHVRRHRRLQGPPRLGHQARHHLPKGIAWYALFTIPLAYLIAVVARRRGGMQRPEAVPLVLLVFVVFALLKTPLEAAITRHREAEADWMARQTTRDPAAVQTLFQRFATTGLSDPSPPTAAYLVFYGHPTFVQRIAMARAWARREGLPEPPANS